MYVDDLSTHLFEVREKDFDCSQSGAVTKQLPDDGCQGSRESKYKTCGKLLEGIRECSVQLNHPVKSVGVTSLDYWAKKSIIQPIARDGRLFIRTP